MATIQLTVVTPGGFGAVAGAARASTARSTRR